MRKLLHSFLRNRMYNCSNRQASLRIFIIFQNSTEIFFSEIHSSWHFGWNIYLVLFSPSFRFHPQFSPLLFCSSGSRREKVGQEKKRNKRESDSVEYKLSSTKEEEEQTALNQSVWNRKRYQTTSICSVLVGHLHIKTHQRYVSTKLLVKWGMKKYKLEKTSFTS